MDEKKPIRIKTRRVWQIKPFERVRKSGKTYSRNRGPASRADENDEAAEPRLVGLDFGERRTGVAISDALGLTAQPLGVVDSEEAMESLRRLIVRYNVTAFVIGYPLNMNGEAGESAKRVEEFAERLKSETGVPYVLVDERLSTRAGERALREMGRKPSKDKAAVDEIAAMMILQSYLDRANKMKCEEEDEDNK